MARYAAVGRCLRHLASGACRPASPVSEYFARTTPCSLPFSNIYISPPTTTRRLARVPAAAQPNSAWVGRDPVRSFGKPPDLGVLVCEALRERSEQRANKYPEVGGLVTSAGGRGLGPARTSQSQRKRSSYIYGPRTVSSNSFTSASRSAGSLFSRHCCFCSRSIGRISTNRQVTQPASS